MALNIKRSKITGSISVAAAVAGLLLAPPRWPAFGFALFLGCLLGIVFVATSREDAEHYRADDEDEFRGFCRIAVTIGFCEIFRWMFPWKSEGIAAIGNILQFFGAMVSAAQGITLMYLLKESRKKKAKPLEPAPSGRGSS